MNNPAILGVILGSIIGAVYVAWQAWDLRRQKKASPDGKVLAMAPGAALRLVFLAGAWWLAFQFTAADKWWLTGALLVTYSLPLVWQVRKLFPARDKES
jgi:small-conductance mechanosensitive channel